MKTITRTVVIVLEIPETEEEGANHPLHCNTKVVVDGHEYKGEQRDQFSPDVTFTIYDEDETSDQAYQPAFAPFVEVVVGVYDR